jgi:hypothetical protein
MVPILLHAGSTAHVQFVLSRGIPYTTPHLNAEKVRDVSLSFAERLNVRWKLIVDGMVWYRCEKDGTDYYIPDAFLTMSPAIFVNDGDGNIPIGSATVDIYNGLPLEYRPGDLVPVLAGYKAAGYESREMLLRREAAKVYERLIDHAERDGINIRILSAFRDAEYQSHLYERALRRKGFSQNAVAKPGHSEHQLGTACDLTSEEIDSGLSESFGDTAAFQWLRDHMTDYGIALSYPKYKIRVTGYIYEPWHYRYMGKERWLALEREPLIFYAQ